MAGAFAATAYWAATDIAFGFTACFAVSVLLAALFVTLMQSWGLYETRNLLALDRQVKWSSAAWLASLGLVLGLAFLLKASADLSRGAIILFAAFGLAVLAGHRLLWPRASVRALDTGLLRRRKALVLRLRPWSDATSELQLFDRAEVELVGRYAVSLVPEERVQTIARVIAAAREHAPDEIVLLTSHDDLPHVDGLISDLRSVPLPVRLLTDATLSRLALQPSSRLGGRALIDVVRAPLSAREQAAKRAFDIVIAVLALLVAGPLLAVASVAIRVETPGPMLFRQSRRGFNGRMFRIVKLRTMTVLEDGEFVSQATRSDPRVTRVGAWLRRTSIDELPQLWNVLRGEMSIVGPRPHAVAHDDHYYRLIQNYAVRHHVKPGITGWAQVNGHRGETPEVARMAARVEHDLWYIRNWSLRMDTRILFLTFTRLLAPGVY